MATNGLKDFQRVIQAGLIYEVSGAPPTNASQARAVQEQLHPTAQIIAADGTVGTADIRGSQTSTGDKSEMPVIMNDINFAVFPFIPNYICLDAGAGVTAILTGVTVIAEVDILAAASTIGLNATAALSIINSLAAAESIAINADADLTIDA